MGEKPPPHVQKSILSGDSEHLSELGKRGAEAKSAAKAEEQKKAAQRETEWRAINAARIKQQKAEARKRDAKIQEELDENAVISPEGDVVHPHDLRS